MPSKPKARDYDLIPIWFSGKRMYRCPFCGHITTLATNMDSHVRTHTKVYLVCPEVGCNFARADAAAISVHRKRAHGYVPLRRGPRKASGQSQPSSRQSSPDVPLYQCVRLRKGGRNTIHDALSNSASSGSRLANSIPPNRISPSHEAQTRNLPPPILPVQADALTHGQTYGSYGSIPPSQASLFYDATPTRDMLSPPVLPAQAGTSIPAYGQSYASHTSFNSPPRQISPSYTVQTRNIPHSVLLAQAEQRYASHGGSHGATEPPTPIELLERQFLHFPAGHTPVAEYPPLKEAGERAGTVERATWIYQQPSYLRSTMQPQDFRKTASDFGAGPSYASHSSQMGATSPLRQGSSWNRSAARYNPMMVGKPYNPYHP